MCKLPFGRLPSPYAIDHPEAITQDGVTMMARFLSPSQALTTFDCEMLKRKIQPVFLIIDNKSDKHYSFSKVSTEASFMPAEEVAKMCARSTMGRVVTYGILGVFVITWIIFIPMLIAEAINCPKINSRIRCDYIDCEMPDATIGPGRSVSGVVFVPPFLSDDKFIVPLVDRDTGEKLLFKFRDYSASWPTEDKQKINKTKKTEKKEKPLEESTESNISF